MLFVVPTPIGNLEDITQRALKVLKEASEILAEDTRRTKALLTHFGISTRVNRYEERNDRAIDGAIERMKQGKSIALVSDSGTPVISDPGLRLVARARAEGVPIVSLPGACAAAVAAAGSGLPADSFVFLGFLPRSAGKRVRYLKEAAALERTVVIYESPNRIIELLEQIGEAAGAQTQVAAARELTKVYEEWLTGTPAEILEKLKAREKILGEFVVVFRSSSAQAEPDDAGI